VKSCSAYGAGYVNISGTDACVKVGGSMTVGGSVGLIAEAVIALRVVL
jgi:hypothetical protein